MDQHPPHILGFSVQTMYLLRLPRTHTSSQPKQETCPTKPANARPRKCPLSLKALAKSLGCLSGRLPKRRQAGRKPKPKSDEPSSKGAPKGKHPFLSRAQTGASGATILVLTAYKRRWQVERRGGDGCRHVDHRNGDDHPERSRRSRSGRAIPPDHSGGVVPDRQGPRGTSSDAAAMPGTTRFRLSVQEVRMLRDKCSDLRAHVNEFQHLVDGIKDSLGRTEHMPNDLAQALNFLTGSVVTDMPMLSALISA